MSTPARGAFCLRQRAQFPVEPIFSGGQILKRPVPLALKRQFPFAPLDPCCRFFHLLPVIIPFRHDDRPRAHRKSPSYKLITSRPVPFRPVTHLIRRRGFRGDHSLPIELRPDIADLKRLVVDRRAQVKVQRPEALIALVRQRNKRGDTRHPMRRLGNESA
jgi:hypothetical protein